MSLGTLLTVFVVPTMYTLLARKKVPGPNKELALAPAAYSGQAALPP
jgi:multidrug efflux pump